MNDIEKEKENEWDEWKIIILCWNEKEEEEEIFKQLSTWFVLFSGGDAFCNCDCLAF